jgi:hypothetical protein
MPCTTSSSSSLPRWSTPDEVAYTTRRVATPPAEVEVPSELPRPYTHQLTCH